MMKNEKVETIQYQGWTFELWKNHSPNSPYDKKYPWSGTGLAPDPDMRSFKSLGCANRNHLIRTMQNHANVLIARPPELE